jgi:hypothetical protein
VGGAFFLGKAMRGRRAFAGVVPLSSAGVVFAFAFAFASLR